MEIIKNKEKDNGKEISDFISSMLKNIDKGIKYIEFELTSPDGKTVHSESPNKISFKLKRK